MSKITKLKIRDFRGIASMDVTAGDINLFAGANAMGKTGVLDAIAAALKGKVPPEAVRHDAKKAEILVELDDGASIHRNIPADGKQTVKVQKNKATLRSPQAWLDELFADEGLNPIEFIRAKDRQKRLLEALPVTTTPAAVLAHLESVGLGKGDVKGLRTDSAHAFEVFTAVADMLADDRKGVNAAVKQGTQWIAQERAEMAETSDPSEEIEALTGELATLKASLSGRESRQATLEKLKLKADGLEASLEDARRRVTELEAQSAETAKDIAETEQAIEADGSAADTAERAAQTGLRLEELRQAKGAWDESQRRAGRVEAKEAELEALKARASALDAGVKLFRKDAPAAALATTPLPVEGLEYRDGAFYVHGTHLDQLSGAETTRVAVAFTLERVRQKGLQIVCVDGIELLDDSQREQFFAEMSASGIQLWATEVDHGRGAPEGEGVLYVVMKDGAPENVQSTASEPIEAPESQTGISF